MRELQEEMMAINGPRGLLAGLLSYPLTGQPRASALIINPHPLMGGHMDQPLMVAIANTLAGRGIATLRFDFAGVGESAGPTLDVASTMSEFWETGTTTDDPHMIEDACAALHRLEHEVSAPLFLIGYSFGALVAMQLLENEANSDSHDTNSEKLNESGTIKGMILIAPTINRCKQDDSTRRNIDTFVIYSDNDFATDAETYQKWIETHPGVVQSQCFESADHFFRSIEDEVAGSCASWMEHRLTSAPQGVLP